MFRFYISWKHKRVQPTWTSEKSKTQRKIIGITKIIASLSACKNQLNSSIHSWDTADFRVPWPKSPTHIWPCSSNNYYSKVQLLWVCISMRKNQFISLIPSWDTANFRVLKPEWPHPSLITPTPIFFTQVLIFMTL